MVRDSSDLARGLDALRQVVARLLLEPFEPQLAVVPVGGAGGGLQALPHSWMLTEAISNDHVAAVPDLSARYDDAEHAASSEDCEEERTRLIALVELARKGDSDAFGMLYDHYQGSVYRFLYYRVGSVALAEDLTSETFFRALRSMGTFQWQGKDFGAWLMTIARNLTTDHFKAGRTRLELSTDDMTAQVDAAGGSTDGPDTQVLASLTNQALLVALKKLPHEQQECLIMRFLQGLSIAETALVLGRSAGAVKQLQLRGVRNLAKLLPEGVR